MTLCCGLIPWKKDKWPASDWDFYVASTDNDELILLLASDTNCSKQDFFIHALYYIVGDCFITSSRSEDGRNRIEKLFLKVNNKAALEVLKWKNDVEPLLSGALEFDINYWVNHFIYNDL
jgi:hypothetical protein